MNLCSPDDLGILHHRLGLPAGLTWKNICVVPFKIRTNNLSFLHFFFFFARMVQHLAKRALFFLYFPEIFGLYIFSLYDSFSFELC